MEFNGFRKALDGLLLTKYPFIKSYKIHENRIYKNKIFLELLGRWDKPISEKLYNEIIELAESLFRMTDGNEGWSLWSTVLKRIKD